MYNIVTKVVFYFTRYLTKVHIFINMCTLVIECRTQIEYLIRHSTYGVFPFCVEPIFVHKKMVKHVPPTAELKCWYEFNYLITNLQLIRCLSSGMSPGINPQPRFYYSGLNCN